MMSWDRHSFLKILFLLSLFLSSKNTYICYNNEEISVLFLEDTEKLFLPFTIYLNNIETIYTKNFDLITSKTSSLILTRSKNCIDLYYVVFNGKKDNIQINNFQIMAGNSGPLITEFRVEIQEDTRELEIALKSIDEDLRMFLNVVNQNGEKKVKSSISYPETNYYGSINESYVFECIYLKIKKYNLLVKLPGFAKWLIPNRNRMVLWRIEYEYSYRENVIDGNISFYAQMVYCIVETSGFDFVFADQPKNVKIKIFATDDIDRRVFDLEFNYENNTSVIKNIPNRGNLGFVPRVFDLNRAIMKKERTPNLVLAQLELWGSCVSPLYKIAKIEIYERFGLKYFHYGLYSDKDSENGKVIRWNPLSYAKFEKKVKISEIVC